MTNSYSNENEGNSVSEEVIDVVQDSNVQASSNNSQENQLLLAIATNDSLLTNGPGVRCAIIEKSTTFSKHPQAHFINNRSMEVFRKLDGLAEEIQQFQPPVNLWRKFIYCTSLYGPVLGSVDHMQPQDYLAWKLAAVVNGIAPNTLINTYETERQPIAIFNTALSVKNFRAAMEVPAALGLDPTIANSVHRVITDGLGTILPSGVQRMVLNGIFSIGRAQLSQTILNERNPLGSSRLARLKRIFEAGKSLQLQFPAEDLGFRYKEGALASHRHVIHDTENVPTGRRRDYVPSSEPGSRLPHMKLRSISNVSGQVMSTLDLISGDNLEFVLIIAPAESSYDLGHATLKVAKKFNILVKVCVIWPENTAYEMSETPSLVGSFTNVMEVKKSHDSPSWWDVCLMNDQGAILVRPDEHIAWRARSKINDPLAEMERVIAIVLGHQERTAS